MSTLQTISEDQPQTLDKPISTTGGVFYASKLADIRSGIGMIKRETLYLGSLDKIVVRLQELFDQWERKSMFPPTVRIEMLHRARLAAHEWIAHLVRHADFEGRVPQIAFSIWVEEKTLCCLIADNSRGFSLDAYPALTPEADYDVMPERGMGWLLIQACTSRLAYRPLGNQGFELEFSIS